MSGYSREDDNEDVWKERCFNCTKCNETVDCGFCSACRAHKTCEARRCFQAKKLYQEKINQQTAENMKQIKAKTAVREAQASTSESMESRRKNQEPEKKKRGRKKGSTTAATRKISERDYVPARPTRQHAADFRRKRTQVDIEHNKLPRQCLNPDCILEARDESKYCSDDCGRALARMRLVEILPTRCKEYFVGADSLEEDLNRKRTLLNNEIQELTNTEKTMLLFIEKLHDFVEKLTTVSPDEIEERVEDNIYEACVVCGANDVMLRFYPKHVERCWSRSEKSISFAAPEKNNENIYCEAFDNRNNSYCKRLKSLCPEHRKGGLELCLRICGYPKKWEVVGDNPKTMAELVEQDDPFGEEGCMVKRENCMKHYKWVPSLRGLIELEQSTLFQRMFELCHESHKLNVHEEWSTNALSILMHKEPIILDQTEYQDYLTSVGSHIATISRERSEPTASNDTFTDSIMSEAAESLATLAIKKTERTSTNTCLNSNTSTSNSTSNPENPPPASTSSTQKSNFSVARLLE